jgi:5-methyltetrahydropteroyltriglutamate--homocysteine methyltransferase
MASQARAFRPDDGREKAKRIFRADHVGSFLRPKYLIDARDAHQIGEIDAEALREVEDRAIAEVVKFQEDAGLEIITDGEYRRKFFHTDFLVQLEGVDVTGLTQISFHKHGGEDLDYAPPVIGVTGKVRHAHSIQRRDFEYLASVTRATPKVTIPSPTMLHFRSGRGGISEDLYPRMEEFFADVGQAYRQEIADLAEAGCRFLQFDDTNLAYLCDETQRENARKRGVDPNDAPRLYAELINSAVRDAPADMVTGIHLCRGNFKSGWAAEGGYEPVAEILFNALDIDVYYLEYDDVRSGDFAPLRFVPPGKTIVLGLVTTKLGELETKDEIKRRIDEAARFVPIEQLALSPQCGFASTVHGNDIAVEQQAAKIRLVVEVAEEVWGSR